MSLKSFLILAIFGFCFISVESFHFNLHLDGIEEKFNSLKDHAENIFNDVKDDWHIISNDIGNGIDTVSGSYHEAKNKTMKLISDAQILYKKIKIESVKNFESFGQVYRDLSKSVNDLEQHGGESLDKFKGLLDELKQDIVDVKEFAKTGNSMILKKDLDNVKVKYASFKTSFDKTVDTMIEDAKIAERDTKVLVNGVEREFTEVLEEAKRLFEEAQTIFHDIVYNGKKSYEQFKKVYKDLKSIVKAIGKAMPAKRYERVKSSLNAFGNFIEKHESVAKISGELISASEEVAAEASLEEALEAIILL